MAWTDPRVWRIVLVDHDDMNAQVRDNQRYLKGIDGPTTRDAPFRLKDQAASTAVLTKCDTGELKLRNVADDTDLKLQFASYTTGTGATDITIGNHAH